MNIATREEKRRNGKREREKEEKRKKTESRIVEISNRVFRDTDSRVV